VPPEPIGKAVPHHPAAALWFARRQVFFLTGLWCADGHDVLQRDRNLEVHPVRKPARPRSGPVRRPGRVHPSPTAAPEISLQPKRRRCQAWLSPRRLARKKSPTVEPTGAPGRRISRSSSPRKAPRLLHRPIRCATKKRPLPSPCRAPFSSLLPLLASAFLAVFSLGADWVRRPARRPRKRNFGDGSSLLKQHTPSLFFPSLSLPSPSCCVLLPSGRSAYPSRRPRRTIAARSGPSDAARGAAKAKVVAHRSRMKTWVLFLVRARSGGGSSVGPRR